MSKTMAERVIGKFPSGSALSTALGHKHASTVSYWKTQGFIPPQHFADILRAAQDMKIQLTDDDFMGAAREEVSRQPE